MVEQYLDPNNNGVSDDIDSMEKHSPKVGVISLYESEIDAPSTVTS